MKFAAPNTSEPFGITDAGLNSVLSINYKTALEKAQAILAKPGEDLPGTRSTTIRQRTAILEMIGPIFHYDNILSFVFGFPSCEQSIQNLKTAQDNPGVDRIILHIDSPGGQVGGVADLSDYIKNHVTKPVTAFIGDMGASAAYWIAAAADRIAAAPTAEVGSIGVVLTARRRDDNQLEIVSSISPKKHPNLNTDAGRQVLQDRADALAEVFTASVARYRGMTQAAVEAMEGNVFVANQALDLGLIDAISTMEDLFAEAWDLAPTRQRPRADFMALVDARVKTEGCKKSVAIGAEAAAHPYLYRAWLLDQQPTARLPQGKPTAQGTPDTPTRPDMQKADFMALVDEYQKENGCKRSAAIGAIAATNPEVHQGWIQAQQK